ncbi:MAG TPA: cupin domain-containing protein [Chthoniobacter sp.]|jgi:cupin 2 domain-containing protein
MKIENLFETLPGPSDREQIRCLLETGEVRIEQIISHAQPSPEGFCYDQPNAEWVLLLKGSATLLLAPKETVELKAGDSLLIPAHLRHRVERTSEDAIWLAVHFQNTLTPRTPPE